MSSPALHGAIGSGGDAWKGGQASSSGLHGGRPPYQTNLLDGWAGVKGDGRICQKVDSFIRHYMRAASVLGRYRGRTSGAMLPRKISSSWTSIKRALFLQSGESRPSLVYISMPDSPQLHIMLLSHGRSNTIGQALHDGQLTRPSLHMRVM